jgi:uncharacterized protein (UPF0210 family)
MKIRSITYFCNPKYPLDEKVIRAAGGFLTTAKSAYEAAGYEVQTTRVATIPFPKLMRSNDFSRYDNEATGPQGVLREVAAPEILNELPRLAEQLEKLIQQIGVGYLSLGPAAPDFRGPGDLGSLKSYEVIPEAIAASQNIFFGGVMADNNIGISLAAVNACANVIVKSAPIEPNGFANLRFAALANVKAGSPFFPAAYHRGNKPAFAIATEAADLAVKAFHSAKTLEGGRQVLIAEIEKHGKALARIANDELSNAHFLGIDFSLAPFPDDAHSLGNAVEKMGVPKIGWHGSLAAAALLTEAVDRADFPHTGFSGFMQPVLEDSVLARRAADGTLTIKDLLLYSTVCGTGLDTVPLPGDTTAEQIVPLLLDLSALSLRLGKPLTARLMPVPGKKAGEPTSFDFGFFANSKVMALDAMPLNSLLAAHGAFSIKSR